MSFPLVKLGEFAIKFSTNLLTHLKKSYPYIQDVQTTIYNAPFVTGVYKKMQEADFLLSKVCRDYSERKNTTAFEMHLAKILPSSQYYGGLLSKENGKACLLHIPFEKYINVDMYKDYKVLQKIENEIAPKILKEMFSHANGKNITLETEESVKQLKRFVLNQESWKEKEIALGDLRRIETKEIIVKAFKKTVTVEFEFTVDLKGKTEEKGIERHSKQHFGGVFDLIHEDGKWIVNSFSFSPFD